MSRDARSGGPPRFVAIFSRATWMSLALALVGPAAAQEGGASKEVDLKKHVQLLGAQGNDKLQQDVEPGDVKLSLTLAVTLPAKPAQTGELATSNFAAEGKSPHRVAPTLAGGGGRPSSDTPQQLSVPLQRSRVAVDLALAGLRRNTMYRGQLLLVSGTAAHTWDIALKTADRGVLAVDKIPMRKLVTLHPCSLVQWWAALASLTRCRPGSDWFTITLRDASGQGPYSNVRVRFDEPEVRRTSGSAWGCRRGWPGSPPR